MSRKYVWLIGTLFIFVGFQNCAKAPTGVVQQGNTGVVPSQVIGNTSQFNKVVFDANLETPTIQKSTSTSGIRLEIDVDAGTMILTDRASGSVAQCALDVSRGQQLKSLLSTSRICTPTPLGADSVSCLALALADVELSGPQDSILLRPLVCNSGTFLCDGNDEKLRDLLADLRANPPTGCH